MLYDARMKRRTTFAIALATLASLLSACNRESSESPAEAMATPQPTAAEPSPPPPPPPESSPEPPAPPKRSGKTRDGVSTGSDARSSSPRASAAHGPKPSSAVVLPSAVIAAEKVVNAGRYDVRLEPTDGGMSIALLQDGAVVASELAVQPVRQPERDATGAWLWHDARQESMYRVYYQAGRSLWFATFPVAP